MTPTTISVGGTGGYDVVIGTDVVADGVRRLVAGAARCAVVVSESLLALADGAAAAAAAVGADVCVLTVPDGEAGKDVMVVGRLWDGLGEMNLTRSDAVVAVGGGATTDVAGFAAASWLRGVRWVTVPTTLLGAVDAAVGGKTGINTPAGKNLVGAFHPPAGVLVDLGVLRTLPPAEWVNGMAEVVKAGFIADPVILDIVEADPAAAADPAGAPARELIQRAVRVKADVVSRDLRESGPREILNYGHTLGHALERHEQWRRPHGHAVALGMVFVAALARHAARLDEPTAARHRSVLSAIGLPTVHDDPGAWPALLAAMAHDKKARGDRLRFVVLDGIGRPGILEAPSAELLAAAWSDLVGG